MHAFTIHLTMFAICWNQNTHLVHFVDPYCKLSVRNHFVSTCLSCSFQNNIVTQHHTTNCSCILRHGFHVILILWFHLKFSCCVNSSFVSSFVSLNALPYRRRMYTITPLDFAIVGQITLEIKFACTLHCFARALYMPQASSLGVQQCLSWY